MSTFGSRNVAQGTNPAEPVLTAVSGEQTEGVWQEIKLGQSSSRISKICGIAQEPRGSLARRSRDNFQRGKANAFPQFSMEETTSLDSGSGRQTPAAEVNCFGAEADLG